MNREHCAITPDSIAIDEEKVKRLIKTLIEKEAFSLTALSGFMRIVTEKELPLTYWHKIFDDFGATIALTKQIAPPMMIKLLTLRCLAIPETEQEFKNWIGQNSSPLITEVYNDFRGKLLRNISGWYGSRFDLFSLNEQGKPIDKTFSTESYQVFINGKLILEKQREIVVVRPTTKQLEIMQNAINCPESVEEEVKIINNSKIVYWLKNSEICVNIISG